MDRTTILRRDAVHEEEYKGYTILIIHDDDGHGSNPRDNDGNAAMITWERDYNSPDDNNEGWGKYDQGGAFDFLDFLKKRRQERHSADPGILYAWLDRNGYDGSIVIRARDEDDPRDLHRADGVIFATYEMIREWYDAKRLTADHKRRAQEGFAGEVEDYSNWAIGNIYGYVVTDDSDENHDSCWGYIGDYDASYGALSAARAYVDHVVGKGYMAAPSDEDCETDMEEEIADYARLMSAA